jgi:hypothetical protein
MKEGAEYYYVYILCAVDTYSYFDSNMKSFTAVDVFGKCVVGGVMVQGVIFSFSLGGGLRSRKIF